MTEGRFVGFGGVEILTRAWRPAVRPDAVVLMSHGFDRRANSADGSLSSSVEGLAVYALDHRGHGRSERRTVLRATRWTSTSPTWRRHRRVKARQPGLPVFLLGHSAGGVIACVYAG